MQYYKGDCKRPAQSIMAGRQLEQRSTATGERRPLFDHRRHGNAPRVDPEIDAVGPVEPIGALELQQGRHLLH